MKLCSTLPTNLKETKKQKEKEKKNRVLLQVVTCLYDTEKSMLKHSTRLWFLKEVWSKERKGILEQGKAERPRIIHYCCPSGQGIQLLWAPICWSGKQKQCRLTHKVVVRIESDYLHALGKGKTLRKWQSILHSCDCPPTLTNLHYDSKKAKEKSKEEIWIYFGKTKQ